MVTNVRIPPVLLLPITAVSALAGIWLVSSGVWDALISHETNDLFTKGHVVIVSKGTDPDQFNRLVCYRLILGTMSGVLAWAVFRLHRWWRTES